MKSIVSTIDNLKLNFFFFCRLPTQISDGSFIVKILKRTADFKVDTNDNHANDGTGNAPGKLQIPKKSKVFLEQTIRECDNASGNCFPTRLTLYLFS